MRERFYCYTCGVVFEKPRSRGYCKPCGAAKQAKRIAESPKAAQAARDATKRWYRSHREEVLAKLAVERRAAGVPEKRVGLDLENEKATKALYRATHPEFVERQRKTTTECAKRRREKEPDVVHALERARYARDRENRISQSMSVRAKRAGAPGSHTIAEWKSVLRHHKRRCVYCNTKLTPKNVSRDHKQPLSRGGTNDIRNIVPACRKCNSKKHDRTFEEFAKVLQ